MTRFPESYMPHRTRLFGLTFVLALTLAFSASDAVAQMCIGVPGSSGQNVLNGAIGFPSNANTFGVEFHHHLADSPLSVQGNFRRISPDAGDGTNLFGAGAAYDLTGNVSGFPPELGFCLVGDLLYGRSDGVNLWEIPIGVGFGGSIALGDGGEVVAMPFAAPAIYHTRASGDGFSTSSTDLDIVLGATFVFPGFHVGLDIQNLFRDAGSSIWGGASYVTLRGGITF